LSWCVKVDILGRLCDDNLERFYNHFTTTNIYFIGAVYNSYFLIIYKSLSLIISPQTFSMQLGAGTAWFCLSQCAIPFCTLSALPKQYYTSAAGSTICRRVTIKSRLSLLMANYSKIKRVELLYSHIATAVEENWNPEK